MKKQIIDITKYEKLLKVYPSGSTVFKEGDTGKLMYIIARGEIEIWKSTNQGRKVLMELGPGNIFGEMSLIDDFPRSASAEAKTHCSLLVIDEKNFDDMVMHNPQFGLKLIRILAQRLRNANQQIYDLVTKDRKNQLLSEIVKYSKEYGKKTFKGYSINFKNFIEHVNTTQGYSTKDTQFILKNLIKNDTLEKSMASDSQIIIPEKIFKRFEDK